MPEQTKAADRLLIGLGMLAAIQLAFLLIRPGGLTAGSDEWLGLGADLGRVEVTDSAGRSRSLSAGVPTLVLVFHSGCAHCRAVAPEWATWLAKHNGDVTTVAVSAEPYASAKAYAAEHQWQVEVLTVPARRDGSLGHALTSRTPWLFWLDSEGRIVTTAHGAQIRHVGEQILGTPP